MRKYLTIWIVALALWGCEDETTWEFQEGDAPIVVDALLTNRYWRHTMRISKAADEFNGNPTPIAWADVSVSNGDSVYTFLPVLDSLGLYRSTSPFSLAVNRTYHLAIEIGDETITASSSPIPLPATMINRAVSTVPSSESGLYELRWTHPEYYYRDFMFKAFLNWSDVPGYENLPLDSTTAILTAYVFNTLDAPQLIKPDQEKVAFPEGTKIRVAQFSLTEDHRDFLRALALETQWAGGWLDAPRGNLPTNLNGNAVGFFATCSAVTQSGIVGKGGNLVED